MAEEKVAKKTDWDCCSPKKWHHHGNDTCGWVYFLGVVGAAVYYIQQVNGFWPVILAVLKAFVWPALLLYKVLTMLHM